MSFSSAAKAKLAARTPSEQQNAQQQTIEEISRTTDDVDNLFMDDLTFTSPSPGAQSSSGMAQSPGSDNLPTSSHASAPAIAIKQRDKAAMANIGAPSSAPQNHFDLNYGGEFGYVQRRVRKTSVDERRVSSFVFIPSLISALISGGSTDENNV